MKDYDKLARAKGHGTVSNGNRSDELGDRLASPSATRSSGLQPKMRHFTQSSFLRTAHLLYQHIFPYTRPALYGWHHVITYCALRKAFSMMHEGILHCRKTCQLLRCGKAKAN